MILLTYCPFHNYIPDAPLFEMMIRSIALEQRQTKGIIMHPPALMPAIPALAEHAYDPLASSALRHALPGIVAAFDEAAMLAHVQAALGTRPGYTITGCELEQGTYTPGEGCVARYILTLAGEVAMSALVSAELFADSRASASFFEQHLAPLVAQVAGRPELRWCAYPAAHLPELAMVLFAYPLDGGLPELLGAASGVGMRARLAPLLAPYSPETCEPELVDYGRQRRCTLRYRLGSADGDMLVYGKLTGDGSGALAEVVSGMLAELGQTDGTGMRFGVPRVLAWLPDLKLSLLENLPGKDIVGDLLKARLRDKPAPGAALSLEDTIEAAAGIAAALHRSGSTIGPRRSLDDELGRLGATIAAMQPFSPELCAVLAEWHTLLSRHAGETHALPLCFNHGDFTPGQMLFDGTSCGLIDFDSVCQAEPALDIAQFITYLTVGGQKSKRTAEETAAIFASLTAHFMQRYCTAAGYAGEAAQHLEKRVALYRSVSMLRRVLRSWQKLKPGRISGALAQAQALFTPAPVE